MGDDIDKKNLERLLRDLILNGCKTFYDGLAIGFDLFAAEVVVNLKKEFSEIKLIGCIPCPSQDKYYSEEEKARYISILDNCDEVKVVSPHYYKGCMFTRDRYMIDNADALIAYDRGLDGGTRYTLEYASTKKKLVFIV